MIVECFFCDMFALLRVSGSRSFGDFHIIRLSAGCVARTPHRQIGGAPGANQLSTNEDCREGLGVARYKLTLPDAPVAPDLRVHPCEAS